MKFEVEINQKGKYGMETIRGEVGSFMAAEQIAELIMGGFAETEVIITAAVNNKVESVKQEEE